MLLRDLMHTNLVLATPDLRLSDAYEVMLTHQFHHFPVMDELLGFVGVLSDRDILRHALRRPGEDVRVGDVMTLNPRTLPPDAHAHQAAALMVELRISCVPIVDRGELVGIVTHIDLLRWLATEIISPAGAAPG